MKILRRTLMIATAILFVASFSYAQSGNAPAAKTTTPKAQVTQNATPRNFVDKNGNGICDNYEARTAAGVNPGRGANFVDKNGDGICDYRQSDTNKGCCGMGNQHRHGRGNGIGCGRGMGPRK